MKYRDCQMRKHSQWLIALALLCTAAIAANGLGADQPQFGQHFSRNMVSDETNLPTTFDPQIGENIRWSVPLGAETNSSPVIADGKVYVGTKSRNLWVFATDKQKKVPATINLDSPIIATPVAANRTLYIATMKKLYAACKTSLQSTP